MSTDDGQATTSSNVNCSASATACASGAKCCSYGVRRLYLATVFQQVVASVRPQELVDAVFACFAHNFSLIEQPSPCVHHVLRERAFASIRRPPSLSCHHALPMLVALSSGWCDPYTASLPLEHAKAPSCCQEATHAAETALLDLPVHCTAAH
jgi:hypothetical protein